MSNEDNMYMVEFKRGVEIISSNIEIFECYEYMISELRYKIRWEIKNKNFYDLRIKKERNERNEILLKIENGNIDILTDICIEIYFKFYYTFKFKIYKYNPGDILKSYLI